MIFKQQKKRKNPIFSSKISFRLKFEIFFSKADTQIYKIDFRCFFFFDPDLKKRQVDRRRFKF